MKHSPYQYFILVILLSLMNTPVMSQSGGMHPEKQIEYVKKQIKNKNSRFTLAYKELLQFADKAITNPVHALTDFSVPGYYQDAVGHRTNSRSLQSDAFDAYASALAYRLSNDKKYAQNAIRFLNAWSFKNEKYSEADGSLVMAYSGTAMVMAAELLKTTKDWKKADRAQFDKWLTNVYGKACNEIRNRKNNWADWGRLGSILTASYLNDQAEIKENIRLIKSDLFDKIADDASMPHETRRGNNGIWYTYFSLAPITAACWVAYQATGENIFTLSQGNRSLKSAMDYLYHYNLHPNEWTWFDGPNVGTPSKWPGALFEAMAEIYNEPKYSDYAEKGRPIVYDTHHFAWTFPTLMPVRLSY
jgi:hypothetical protein